jgi:hypothetical protein
VAGDTPRSTARLRSVRRSSATVCELRAADSFWLSVRAIMSWIA